MGLPRPPALAAAAFGFAGDFAALAAGRPRPAFLAPFCAGLFAATLGLLAGVTLGEAAVVSSAKEPKC